MQCGLLRIVFAPRICSTGVEFYHKVGYNDAIQKTLYKVTKIVYLDIYDRELTSEYGLTISTNYSL
ncbi:hypothetical protein BDP27DRAFT_1311917 [Rhodocollybia butyracea]|uniref:Uncharacterized protein n=1 Tax=Rhodocollybia butyracea TaxID=206335 RepID=A0A9P5QB33_9AGAR|nr:hypothetical protein BDP27DRAFT_1311917 [Rhodocollybia butyracea]